MAEAGGPFVVRRVGSSIPPQAEARFNEPDTGAKGLSVSTRAFTSNDDCGLHSCFVSGKITLNEDDEPGTMAVALSHEYAHATEKPGKTKWDFANNEARAWSESRKVYNKLPEPYKKQAVSVFGADFTALSNADNLNANKRVWACKAEAKSKGESTAACVP